MQIRNHFLRDDKLKMSSPIYKIANNILTLKELVVIEAGNILIFGCVFSKIHPLK